jgi:2'-5' RNA ligase
MMGSCPPSAPSSRRAGCPQRRRPFDIPDEPARAGEEAAVVSHDLVNHWSDLPGWHEGRSLWAMYFTFLDNHPLHRAVLAYQDAIRDVPGIDLIDLEWLHLTMQGIAFADEVADDEVQEISRRLGEIVPPPALPTAFSVQPPILDHDAVILPVVPTRELSALRNILRSLTKDVLDGRAPYRLPDPVGGFRPHISIAYPNRDMPGGAVTGRLSTVRHEDVELGLSHLSFLLLQRSRPRWFWTQEYRVPLREPGAGSLVRRPPATERPADLDDGRDEMLPRP